MDLTLVDLIGGIVEADNDIEARQMVVPGRRFYAFFRAHDARREERHALLYLLPFGESSQQWMHLMFLCSQFPSLDPDGSASYWTMSKRDYAKMRLFFGGQEWT